MSRRADILEQGKPFDGEGLPWGEAHVLDLFNAASAYFGERRRYLCSCTDFAVHLTANAHSCAEQHIRRTPRQEITIGLHASTGEPYLRVNGKDAELAAYGVRLDERVSSSHDRLASIAFLQFVTLSFISETTNSRLRDLRDYHFSMTLTDAGRPIRSVQIALVATEGDAGERPTAMVLEKRYRKPRAQAVSRSV